MTSTYVRNEILLSVVYRYLYTPSNSHILYYGQVQVALTYLMENNVFAH